VTALSTRLRQLRAERWPRRVRQGQLASALGIQNTSISEWESDRADAKQPNDERLHDIATFFATPRSLNPPRLLSDDELTDEERVERDRLYRELLALRDSGPDPASTAPRPPLRHPWAFDDGAPVLIICGALDPDVRPPYASGENHNYMALSGYADQDALVELFGAIRARNPTSDVRFELSRRLENDDLQAHLVLLGNLAWADAVTLVGDSGQPVRPVRTEGLDGEPLQQVDASGAVVDTHRPRFLGDDPTQPVIEDVGYFYRAPSRTNSTRTLTICGGVFTRGVYGAVRCLTDERAGYNVDHVAAKLSESPTYGLLMRVPVTQHATGTPDLRDPQNRLYEHTESET
jgi:transcriptional regulator with XRE-family HTH domain